MADCVILLASNSPRRKQLLTLTGLAFQVWPADIDETRMEGEVPWAYVLRLAQSKAQALLARLHTPSAPPGLEGGRRVSFILAADTIVVDGDDILGKPESPAEARRMLQQLRGHQHQVYTALAIISMADEQPLTDICVTQVPMRLYTDEEIDAYIASGDPMDKAGAYAIQHADFHPVENLAGCFASVMGLPLCHLVRSLRQIGLNPERDVPETCQQALNYDCPVSSRILAWDQAG